MLFARFLRDREGGVAPLLALGIIPLVAAVGAAVDYSRAGSVRTAMQAAGDATALMLAKNASTLTANEPKQNATSYFQANFNRPDTQNLQVSASYGQGSSGYTVTVNSSSSETTSFMGLAGVSQIPISTTGSVNWNNSKLRVALMLDNAGSMSQRRQDDGAEERLA